MDETKTVTIYRAGGLPLEFDGRVLGFATSDDGVKERWFEVAIYATVTGKYVVHGAGMSEVDGEEDRHWAEVCETPAEVVAALQRTNENGVKYLPRTSQDALRAAVESDADFAAAYLERV